ncbi:MAG: D-alanyl-D-alanine carboxypeptidase [Coriobacteriia bacterium]|nr:D-alanyl-D-alanine carboxypeptidase [Coriobacteriia bacterium]
MASPHVGLRRSVSSGHRIGATLNANAIARRFAAFAITLSLAAGVLGVPATALAAKSSGPSLYVPEASVMTMDGVVLWSRNADKPRRIASCTKMLTALVVRDRTNLDDVITVSQKAASVDDGAVGLVAGQKYTVRQLLGVMLVHSANGAAEALASGIGGNEKRFVAMMNAKAKALGLKHTRAMDPHGLSPKGYSTANDLSVIARRLMADPQLRAIVGQTHASLPRGKSGWATFPTTDRLLGTYSGTEGIKTGYTDPAGYCFVGAFKRNGVELLGVVLGAEAPNDRFTQMTRMVEWGFSHVVVRNVVSTDATMGVVDVSGGTSSSVTVHARRPLAMTVSSSGGSTTTQVSLLPTVSAPVQAGQTLGALQVTSGGSIVASVPLVADESIAVPPPAPVATPRSASAVASPSIWQRISGVMAGLGRMLGI